MKRLIQISDTHIVVPPALVSSRLNTVERLEQTVGRIAEVLAKVGPASALLVSGDITDRGDGASFALFREIVGPLGLPILAIPGNHDRREPMREAFADTACMPETGPLNWVHDFPGLRVIGLDTLVEGQGGGALDAATLGFFEEALDMAREGPVLVTLHHPPFQSGMCFMDAIGLENPEALAAIVRGSDREVHVTCGHIHNVQIGSIGGAPTLSAPAVCSTFDVNFQADAPTGFMDAPGGFLVHDWESEFRTLVVPFESGSGPFPF